jgi:hypothetical protein
VFHLPGRHSPATAAAHLWLKMTFRVFRGSEIRIPHSSALLFPLKSCHPAKSGFYYRYEEAFSRED